MIAPNWNQFSHSTRSGFHALAKSTSPSSVACGSVGMDIRLLNAKNW